MNFKGKNNPFYGKHHSKESIKKMSETRKEMYRTGKLIHPLIGKHHSKKSKKKISISIKKNIESISLNTKRINEWNRKNGHKKRKEKNPMWKGENVSYRSLHQWVVINKPKLELCEICGKKSRLDCANISGEYKRDVNDYQWLCRYCHMKKDGRINNLKQYNSIK